jgi:hypothetical protein
MNPQDKRYFVIVFVIVVAVLYSARLFYVQVIDDRYKLARVTRLSCIRPIIRRAE